MIQITFYKNNQDAYQGFHFIGHAGYDIAGEDVVCAGVSALAITTINSIESLTDAQFTVDSDEKSGMMALHMVSAPSHDTELLFKSLYIGCQGISDAYGTDYVKIHFKEV